jgi:hypothetical protein
VTETQGTDVLYKGLPQHFEQIVTYLSSGLELMKSVGSNERLSLLFMIKGMAWHFMSDAHKVTTALMFILPLLCCRGVFSAIYQYGQDPHFALTITVNNGSG